MQNSELKDTFDFIFDVIIQLLQFRQHRGICSPKSSSIRLPYISYLLTAISFCVQIFELG